MDKVEIRSQIQKFKARRIQARLAHYGTSLSLFLALSIFGSGITTSSIYSFLLFLPVLSYFSLHSLKFIRKSHILKAKLHELEVKTYQINPYFSVKNFLFQPSLPFRLTLLLIIFTLFTTFARFNAEPKSNNLQSMSYTVSPY